MIFSFLTPKISAKFECSHRFSGTPVHAGWLKSATFDKQEAFEKCWAHSPLRAAARPNFTLPFTRCRYCRTPPGHRCSRQQRRRQQRQRVTEGTAMAPWNGPNYRWWWIGGITGYCDPCRLQHACGQDTADLSTCHVPIVQFFLLRSVTTMAPTLQRVSRTDGLTDVMLVAYFIVFLKRHK